MTPNTCPCHHQRCGPETRHLFHALLDIGRELAVVSLNMTTNGIH
jgi:hypothetical protein